VNQIKDLYNFMARQDYIQGSFLARTHCMKLCIILMAIVSSLAWSQTTSGSRQMNPHGNLKMNCSDCHSPKRWKPTKRIIDFDHAKTGFPLSGSHSSILCTECHKDLKFQSVSSSCADCHQDIHKGKFGTDCQSCHTTKKFSAEFLTVEAQAHNEFPLVGFHALDECAKCHKNQAPKNYANTPTQCNACHMNDFDKAKSPNHRSLNFSTDCATCHASAIIKGWSSGAAGMSHPATLPLTGAHGKASCYDCHKKDTFAGLNPTCATCHQADFDKTTKPNHRELAFPTDCAACHTNVDWRASAIPAGTSFKHPEAFPLTGGHAKPKCADCHSQGYIGTKSECSGCHEKDFVKAAQPNHVDQKFSRDCKQCHNTGAWKGAMIPPGTDFQHPATFPLKGGHAVATCTQCHKNGQYTNTPTACLACHQTDYDTTRSPNHLDLAFGTDCMQCHNVNDWKGAAIPTNHPFQHPATFPLVEGHAQVDCAKCHAQGYAGTPTQCASCHDPDYKATTKPNHAELKFSTDCAQCHKVRKGWMGATIPPNSSFQHPATFPLNGGHAKAACATCHANGYADTPMDCAACHKDEFDKTTQPNHTDLAFSTQCKTCHTVDTWKGAQIGPGTPFTHPTTFPLTRPHDQASCTQCHASGYTNTSTDCYACHCADYEAVKSPNHVTANYSTNCLSCHKKDSWDGASINHEKFFPIATGRHSGFQCSECHVVDGNYKAFECILCHEHSNKAKVDADHRGEANNYRYTSEGCYSCHPRGNGD
jgi:hypothetical protein